MAPEQISTPESVDHRADIFSTGVVGYEMLTGAVPQRAPQPPSTRPGVDPRFDPIVLRALEADRGRRYQQIRDLNEDVLLLSRTPGSTIRMTRSVDAPVEEVFAAWTDPALMTRWYAPTDEYTTPIAEVDLRVGGNYRVAMKHKDRPNPAIVSGQYCSLSPPTSISFTWAWETLSASIPETQVTIDLRPTPGGSEMTLTHERFRDEELRQKHEEGWTGCLGRLVGMHAQ
jgi:uncharacterized protein YndB with AHSA1/START domain